MDDRVKQLATILIYSCYNSLEDAAKHIITSIGNTEDLWHIWTTPLQLDFLQIRYSALETCVMFKKRNILRYFFHLPPIYINTQPDDMLRIHMIKSAIRICTHTEQCDLIPSLVKMFILPESKPLEIPLEEKNPTLAKDSNACIACTKNVKNVAILPCGHVPFCVNCCRHYILNERKKECPNCRGIIKQLVKIFN